MGATQISITVFIITNSKTNFFWIVWLACAVKLIVRTNFSLLRQKPWGIDPKSLFLNYQNDPIFYTQSYAWCCSINIQTTINTFNSWSKSWTMWFCLLVLSILNRFAVYINVQMRANYSRWKVLKIWFTNKKICWTIYIV